MTKNATEHNQTVLDSIFTLEKFDNGINYKPLSLHFKGKPIFSIGQKENDNGWVLTYEVKLK